MSREAQFLIMIILCCATCTRLLKNINDLMIKKMNEKISVIFFYVRSGPIRFDSVLKELRIDAWYEKARQVKGRPLL